MINTNFTTTESSELKVAYSNDINQYFKEKKIDWGAYPAPLTNQVFIHPDGDTEYYSFKKVGRINVVNDQTAGQLVYMTAQHSLRDLAEYSVLVNSGWKDNKAKLSSSILFGLKKEFSNFDELVDLVNEIESVLKK